MLVFLGGFSSVRKSPNNLNLAIEFISIRNTCKNDISVFLEKRIFVDIRFGVGLFRNAQKILQGHCQYLFLERVPCLLVVYGSSNSIPRKSWQPLSLNTRDISRRNDLKKWFLIAKTIQSWLIEKFFIMEIKLQINRKIFLLQWFCVCQKMLKLLETLNCVKATSANLFFRAGSKTVLLQCCLGFALVITEFFLF